ncbi:MAG: hypothetical protein CVU47_06110, partial [Chloroflexi bacterium HGW-Chloroflexi-9]
MITSPAEGTLIEDSSFLVEGTGIPGATIMVTVTGASMRMVTVPESGLWSVSVGVPLSNPPEGFDVSATQQVADGPASLPSNVVHLSNYVPPPEITAPRDGAVILTPTFTVRGTGVPGYSILLQTGRIYVTTVDASGNWTVADVITEFLPPAGFDVSAAQNLGGALSSAMSNVVHITTVLTPPVIGSPADGAATPASVIVTGIGALGATVTVFDGATALISGPVNAVGEFTFLVTLSAGAHVLSATQTLSGFTSDPSNIVTVTVTSPPPPTPTVTTEVHDAAHNAVSSVTAGTAVHARVGVTGTGAPLTGRVKVFWYDAGGCLAGTHLAVSPLLSLVDGAVDATSFAQTPSTLGTYSFQAVYSGDPAYQDTTGPCVPFTVDPLPPATVTTQVHDASHTVVTSAVAGITVHPFVQ